MPEFEPSMVTKSAANNWIIDEAELPEIIGLVPASGLIVNGFAAETPVISGTTIGKAPSVLLL